MARPRPSSPLPYTAAAARRNTSARQTRRRDRRGSCGASASRSFAPPRAFFKRLVLFHFLMRCAASLAKAREGQRQGHIPILAIEKPRISIDLIATRDRQDQQLFAPAGPAGAVQRLDSAARSARPPMALDTAMESRQRRADQERDAAQREKHARLCAHKA